MRVGAAIFIAVALTGCASQVTRSRAHFTQVPEPRHYEESTASALVFDPPVAYGEPALELSREDRIPSAFVAFDEPIITYYWIHTDDWQGSDWGSGACGGRYGLIGDCFQRRAVIDKVGVSYR